MGDTGWAQFRVNFSFEPRDLREIAIGEGDILLVAKPVKDPSGWLLGENTRTKEVGEFPGTYVEYIGDVEDLGRVEPRPPPRPPKIRSRSRVSSAAEQDGLGEHGGHSLTEKLVLKPVWCCKCEDFIWGAGRQFYRCTGCDLSWHLQCAVDLAEITCIKHCSKDHEEDQEDTYIHLVTSPEQWQPDDVLIWLAAIRSYLYAETFRENDVSGYELHQIMEEGHGGLEKLNVVDGTHKQIILLAMQELFTGQSEARRPELFSGLQTAKKGSKGSHLFHEETFTSLQWCDKCGKCLWGLHRQGVQCSECGYNCHRMCMYDSVVVCPRRRVRRRRESDADAPVFGQELESQFHPSIMPAPIVVMKCVQAIEKRGLKMLNVHSVIPAGSEKHSLKTALNQSAKNVNMDDEEWRSPHCVSAVLKMYLQELPSCIFTEEQYHSFVKTFKGSRDSVGGKLMDLVESLPGANKAVLNYLMEHLYKVSKNMEWNDMSSTKLASVFAPILLRPSHKHITALVENHKTTVEIIDALITGGEWTREVIPAVPPRRRLEECPWYWGEINKETVSERLKDQPDGTFIVRDSRRLPGEYTLTLRKGGLNRLIRILHNDGMYGFSEPLTFSSLVELITYYRDKSLASYNAKLDVRLSNPLNKYEQDEDEDGQDTENVLYDKLREINDAIKSKSDEYDDVHQNFTQSELEIADCREELEAQHEIIKLMEEQIKLAETFQKEAPPQDRAILRENYEKLLHRLGGARGVLIGLEKELSDATEKTRLLDKRINKMRPQIIDLQRRQQKYYLVLQTTEGLGVDEIRERMEPVDLSENLWKYGIISREETNDRLIGKPDGTFLVRESARRPGDYALSLSHNGTVKHIIINHGAGGYGIAVDCNTHPTLADLVEHYHFHSLEVHNSDLKTTLKFPLGHFPDDS